MQFREAIKCQVDAATGIPGHNTPCNVSYTYQIVGVSQGGGWSTPTAAVSTSAGSATLSTNNNLLVSWTGAANDIAYLIYSCSGASCTPTLHAAMPHAGAPGRHGRIASRFRIASGSVDILRFKWDGTNWLEISRSIGDH